MSSPREVTAGILVTGNEVLNGVIRDENGPWLSRQLASIGLVVEEILLVPDRIESLVSGMEQLAGRDVDLIITTGGLGPTADDKTAEAAALFTGRPLHLDGKMEAKIRDILARYARTRGAGTPGGAIDEANRKQALVPEGARTIDPVGTAPGLIIPPDQTPLVIVLPGPPRELRPMWDVALTDPDLVRLANEAGTLDTYRLRMFGTPESELAQALREIEDEGLAISEIEVTTCLRKGELEIDVRYRPGQELLATTLREELDSRFPETLFSLEGESIDEIVAGLLRGRTLAVAESCTAGLLAARIASRPGSSAYFAGGVVTYSNEAKSDLLGVPMELIESEGAVSPEVAREMASGAGRRLEADVSVAITGVAGPDGGTDEKPVGYVCFHAAADGRDPISLDPVIPGGRNTIRERSALVGMHMLRMLLS